MHRDVKLGLALGILVIGFAAAFCFPRQSATEIAVSPSTGLKLAAIDEEIRLERRRTFVGEELTPPEQPTLAEPLAEVATVNPELPPLQTAAMRARELASSAPEPIRRDVPTPPADSELGGAELNSVHVVNDTVAAAEPAAEEIFYTVQSGDTLSGVASKTLGSSRKFEAIYEANRDILATPNSLQIGMKLRIPQQAESIAKRGTPTATDRVAARVETPAPTEASPSLRGMFSPVGRAPRYADQSDMTPR